MPSMEYPYYSWSPEGHAVRVALGHGVVRQLRAQLRQKTEESPEFGALLLGRIEPGEGDNWLVTIDGLALVESEYRYGPNLVLSPRDRERLQRQIARHNGRVVGFFRSHARRGLYLDNKDFALFELYFRDGRSVFMLARQGDPRATAGFFFWEGDDVHRQAPYLEFSLADAAPEAAPAVLEPAAPALLATTEPASAAPALSPERRLAFPFDPRQLRTAGIAAMVVLTPVLSFLAARALVRREHPRRPAVVHPAAQQFSLRARQSGRLLELVWDPSDPLVRKADHGHLTVFEGSDATQLWLDGPRLATGKFVYRPHSRQAEFRLELYSILDRERLGASLEGQDEVADDALSDTRGSRLLKRPRRRRFGRAARSTPPPPPSAPPEMQRVAAAQTSITLPDLPPATPGSPNLDVSPQVSGVMPAAPRPPSQSSAASAARPAPAGSFRAEPVPPSRFRAAVQHVPVLRSLQRRRYKAGQRFVPAKVLRSNVPILAAAIKVREDTEVDVVARIDKAGRVTRTAYSRTADRMLGRLAADAVTRWRFAPATLNGSPVSSDVVLHFKFPATQPRQLSTRFQE